MNHFSAIGLPSGNNAEFNKLIKALEVVTKNANARIFMGVDPKLVVNMDSENLHK